MLGSARATNEENYLTQKFARTVIGTNNVDCCARVCHAPSAAALKASAAEGDVVAADRLVRRQHWRRCRIDGCRGTAAGDCGGHVTWRASGSRRTIAGEMRAQVTLEIVPGATHLFEERGTLERVAELAGSWFERHLQPVLSARPR